MSYCSTEVNIKLLIGRRETTLFKHIVSWKKFGEKIKGIEIWSGLDLFMAFQNSSKQNVIFETQYLGTDMLPGEQWCIKNKLNALNNWIHFEKALNSNI